MKTWRAYKRVSSRGAELSAYATRQALELERIANQLNEHGFELGHTLEDLGPKLETLSLFLRQPLIAATIPWMLRRVLRRPYRRR